MTTIITNTQYNFRHAESDLFIWDDFEEEMLTYKPTGQKIYQMSWYEWKNSQRITDAAIIAAVKEFRNALKELKAAKPAPAISDYTDPEPKHGEHGYCRKCHSYCWGDCQSNN